MILEAAGLTKRFGGLVAVDHLDMSVAPGSVHAIVGPNGSGKTTLFNMISGAAFPSEGTISFEGARLDLLPPHRRARIGIKRTFQNIRLFEELTVLENVLAGQHAIASTGFTSLFRQWSTQEKAKRDAAMETLKLFALEPLAGKLAGELAYGPKRLVEIARAIASAPKLLLLDEPTSGMSPRESEDMVASIQRVSGREMTVMIIEHHLPVVKNLADRVTVLNFGRKIAEGSAASVFGDPAVVEAYLGAEVAE
ncbi:MAG: ABC transporter ATP-binding protein [Betaproteobacteria bacterium]|nr:ABC transporter ATP-binding protein [Betaproteobacteria bacterium]